MAGSGPAGGAGEPLGGAAIPPLRPIPSVQPERPTQPTPLIALAADLVRQMLDHAWRESPRECCGLLTLAGASVEPSPEPWAELWGPTAVEPRLLPLTYHPARNLAESPARYDMHPDDLLRVLTAAEQGGEALWGLVHSHVRHEAFPSDVDRQHAYYPEALYLILSLWRSAAVGQGFRAFGEAVVRGYRIVDGGVEEVPLLSLPIASVRQPGEPL